MFQSAMNTVEGPRRGRGRPRTPGAEDRILAAALEEYGERGWAGFTMDAVARRAGVGKSTVYLRWQDKDSLLTDAVADRGMHLEDVDTGSLAGDLRQFALNLLHYYGSAAGWAALRITFDSASAHDRLGEFAQVVDDVHGQHVREICRRAVERGEMSPDVPASVVSEAVYGMAIVSSLAMRLEGRDDSAELLGQQADRMATLVLRGIGTAAGSGWVSAS